MSPIKSIILVRLSAIGDVCLVLPVVRSLLQALPDTQITWVVDRLAYQLLAGIEDHPNLTLEVIDKPKKIKDYLALRSRFKDTEFDVLLAMQASLRSNLIYPCIRAKRKIGFDLQRARDGQRWFVNERIEFNSDEHLLDSFFAFARKLGVTEKAEVWDIPIPRDVKDWHSQQLAKHTPYIMINPAASKPERSWLPDRYAAIIDQLTHRGFTCVLTGGPSAYEKELGQGISELSKQPPLNLIGQTSLKQLAAVAANACLCISPDTGPAHIACAMGTPVVGLYAVAPASLSRPYSYPDLVVDKFDEAVTTILNKDPRDIPWGTRVHSEQAMALISVEDVMAKVDLAL